LATIPEGRLASTYSFAVSLGTWYTLLAILLLRWEEWFGCIFIVSDIQRGKSFIIVDDMLGAVHLLLKHLFNLIVIFSIYAQLFPIAFI
jgi:hypothetical protein